MRVRSGVRGAGGPAAPDRPPLHAVASLDRICTGWAERWGAAAVPAADAGGFGGGTLREAGLAPHGSACHGVLWQYRGQQAPPEGLLTAVPGPPRRDETDADGTRRTAPRTREVVAVGTAEQVSDHLLHARRFLRELSGELGLPLERVAAPGPRHDEDERSAGPVAYEHRYRGRAIASENRHLTYFGERCSIVLPDGGPASSSCVALGLDGWLNALADHFEQDWGRVLAAVDTAERFLG
ncbi:hypothetical protein [Streptomyces sp. Da 82-17]|uniref:hypothetical protein n=1 Tax=Streptomyces sp. Da 82-17 TaxID=3377116 RepID=UPI0038D4D1B6